MPALATDSMRYWLRLSELPDSSSLSSSSSQRLNDWATRMSVVSYGVPCSLMSSRSLGKSADGEGWDAELELAPAPAGGGLVGESGWDGNDMDKGENGGWEEADEEAVGEDVDPVCTPKADVHGFDEGASGSKEETNSGVVIDTRPSGWNAGACTSYRPSRSDCASSSLSSLLRM